MNSEKINFLEEQLSSQEKGVLLGLGNAMIDMYDFQVQTNQAQLVNLLAQNCKITSRASYFTSLNWLLQEGHRESEKENFPQIKNEKEHIAAFKTLYRLLDLYKFEASYITDCQTLIAWDLEQAAFLTRYAYQLGYLTEAECWEILQREIGPVVVSAGFKCWKEYAASLLVGRCWCYGGYPSELLFSISELLDGEELSIWQKYEFSSLS